MGGLEGECQCGNEMEERTLVEGEKKRYDGERKEWNGKGDVSGKVKRGGREKVLEDEVRYKNVLGEKRKV